MISQNLFGRAWSLTMILRILRLNLHNVQKNRLSEKCGEGFGPSCHTGGSRTHQEHARQLVIVLGRSPHLHGLLKKTHTKANDEFVDLKSKSTYDVVMSKITSTSHLVDESGESSTIDFSKVYMHEVGGLKKACIYGVGSQAVFYENIGSSSASTTQSQDGDFDARVKEYVHEMKEEMREELREEMKHEMQLEMQEQVDKILQERLSILIAGLPKPPRGTMPSGTPHYLRHDSSSNSNMGHLKFFRNILGRFFIVCFRIWIYFELFMLGFALLYSSYNLSKNHCFYYIFGLFKICKSYLLM